METTAAAMSSCPCGSDICRRGRKAQGQALPDIPKAPAAVQTIAGAATGPGRVQDRRQPIPGIITRGCTFPAGIDQLRVIDCRKCIHTPGPGRGDRNIATGPSTPLPAADAMNPRGQTIAVGKAHRIRNGSDFSALSPGRQAYLFMICDPVATEEADSWRTGLSTAPWLNRTPKPLPESDAA